MKIGLWDHHTVCVSVNPPPINFWMPVPIIIVYLPIIARQWFGKNIATAMNTYAKIEELLDVSLSMQAVPYQRKAGD
jgi:hypothetical protein